jgi:hypothetical protein
MSDEKREIGIECSCGFRRRATQTAEGGKHWNGREIEALHTFEIFQERSTWPETGPALPTHHMSTGLLATMDWPALTEAEQQIGEAWMGGVATGDRYARERMRVKLERVTAVEFAE